MDHLPKVKEPFAQNVYPIVPYLSRDLRYDASPLGYEGFSKFPSRWGYETQALERGDLGGRHIDEATTFLQAWLFFGLLTEVLGGIGVPFQEADFVREADQGGPTITTQLLPRYIWYWLAAHCHSDRDVCRLHERHVKFCLKLTNTILNAINRLHIKSSNDLPTSSSSTSAVLFSLVILGETLSQAKGQIDGSWIDAASCWHFPPLIQALKSAGWCIGQISDLLKNCDSSTLLYLSTFEKSILGKDHGRCDAKTGCRAYQINYDTYATKHAAGCRMIHCSNLAPPMEEIAAILRDGDIPLIAVDSSCIPTQLEVIRYTETSEYHNEYIAISHVWSDGLGNPHENSLPRCQLERIQQLVNRLWDPQVYIIPFWIDTLCVPLAPKLKSLAIERMDKTYSAAYGVLVFDNSLQIVSSKISPTEALMRIVYSTWMTRLWTFQEGRLSRKQWFQFKEDALSTDGLRNISVLRPNYNDVSSFLLQEDVARIRSHPNAMQLARALTYESHRARLSLEHYASLPEQEDPDEEDVRLGAIQALEERAEKVPLASIWKPILALIDPDLQLSEMDEDLYTAIHSRAFGTVIGHACEGISRMRGQGGEYVIGRVGLRAEKPGHRPPHQLIDVCRGLKGRTTSRSEDETICLSVLLGLDVAQVVKIPTIHWRIKEFLMDMRNFLAYLYSITRKAWCHVYGASIIRLLRSTHERRMKIVLSQVEFFPKCMIFWDTPRLQLEGWRWAPFSFLDPELDTGNFKGGPRGHRVKEGLLIKCSALRLNKKALTLQPVSTSNLTSELSFVIHGLDGFVGHTGRSWQCAHFRIKTRAPMSMHRLTQCIQDSMLDSIVLLVDGKDGVLLSIYEEDCEITYARHIAAIERLPRSPSQKEDSVHVSVEWLPERSWCIG